VAVDVERTAQILGALADDSALLRHLGASGRERAVQVYDWSVVIRQYQELLAELAERRDVARRLDPNLAQAPALSAPLRADPYRVFSGYPSGVLGVETPLRLTPAWSMTSGGPAWDQMERLQQFHEDPLFRFAASSRLPLLEICELLTLLACEPGLSVLQIADRMKLSRDQAQVSILVATAAWLQKLGIVCLP
jgi:hypothetical protein